MFSQSFFRGTRATSLNLSKMTLSWTRLRRLPILAALAYCALDRWIMV
jgi:hypothetical protein